MNEADYLNAITKSIDEKRALVLKDGNILVGAMAFSDYSGCIDFLGINPQYRKQGIQKLFLDALMEIYLPGQEISMTTYREGDKADTGHRDVFPVGISVACCHSGGLVRKLPATNHYSLRVTFITDWRGCRDVAHGI